MSQPAPYLAPDPHDTPEAYERTEKAQRRRAADPEFMAELRARVAASECKNPTDRMNVEQLIERFPDMRRP